MLNAGDQPLSVSFTPTDTANYNAAPVTTVTLKVLKATPVITWANPADITYGTALSATQLNATATVPGSFTYDPAAGTVLNAGDHQLSASFTPTDAANYNAVPVTTVTLKVLKATPVITWANPADITYGTALSATQLNATANVPGSFTYDPAAGTVLNAGDHPLSVSFTPTDTANYNAVPVTTVTLKVLKATPVITWANPADITYGTALSATQLNATANVPGSFTYDPAAGTVLNAGDHPLSVSFTPTDTANYNAVPVTTVTLKVLKATPVITWANPADITYGTALSATQLNATATVPGSFTYDPAAGTVLNAGDHPLSASFTPTDAANYNAVPVTTVTLKVLKATPVITWANPADITYGTALSATQLNATANVPGSFTYDPAAGTVLNAGDHQLSASFTPTDAANYNAVPVTTVTLKVLKATPVITWANPTDITYGTALSATQLNATANVPGSFIYDPAAGTVLNVGQQLLSVSFTPNDTANYAGATKTVTLNVLKWSLKGFYQPVGETSSIVSAPGTVPAVSGAVWNTIKGGQTVPLKFNIYRGVGGAQVTTVAEAFSTPAFGVYQLTSCSGAPTEDPVDGDLSSGGTELRWDGTQFIQNWKTPKVSGADLCYRAVITAKDGSTISAFFKVKK